MAGQTELTNKVSRKILKEVPKNHPMKVRTGYWPRINSYYIIYQWNWHGAIVHANFYYPV